MPRKFLFTFLSGTIEIIWKNASHTAWAEFISPRIQCKLRSLGYVQFDHMYRRLSDIDEISISIFLQFYSGLKLTRFGRSVDWSFFMSSAVTLQDSRVSDFKFLRGLRCCKPALVIREFAMFKETSCVSPANVQGNTEHSNLDNKKARW